MKLLLDADIIPNEGLGGLRLRTQLSAIQDLVAIPDMYTDPSRYSLVSPFEARYVLAGGAMEIGVDVRNGKVFKLTAREGYTGLLFGKISVGMLVSDAQRIEPRLKYDEGEESVVFYGVSSLVIDVAAVDPPPELVPTMPISAISVFAAEIVTADGQQGYW